MPPKEKVSERAYEKIIEAQTSEEFLHLDEAIDDRSERVSELVKESGGEDLPAKSKSNKKATPTKKGFDFSKFSNQITGLIGGSNKPQKIKLPPVQTQRKKVVKALQKEVKGLVKEAHKIQNSKKFCPNKLEKVLIRIRHLQKKINQVMHLAKDTLTQWYKRYVVRQS